MKTDSDYGTVRVIKNAYKPSGCFHFASPVTPIRNEQGALTGITNPRDIVHIHAYGGESIFFESLGQGRLLATRCDNPGCEACGSIFQPFRIHCPDCLARASVIDMTEIARNSARVHTFMITERTGAFNILPTPIKFINVEFAEVCTILMGYLCLGEPQIGMRVVPVFNTEAPTQTILDLSWVPDGTDETQLPQHYHFG
jgi:hypothetical protein